MKKFLVAILAILYMGVSSGIAMEIHYCMGKKAGVEFYGKDNDKCGKCGMKDKKGCCDDDHKFYKLSDSHKNVANDISFNIGEIATITTSSFQNYELPIVVVTILQNNSPPGYTRPPARILNGVFRL